MNSRTFVLHVSSNPFLRILSLIVLGALLIGAIALGAVLLTGLLMVAVVAAIVISVRVWWLNRKLRRSPGEVSAGRAPPGPGQLIEADYVVVRDPANDGRAAHDGRAGSDGRAGRDGRAE